MNVGWAQARTGSPSWDGDMTRAPGTFDQEGEATIGSWNVP
jgi:hypothetical protein